MLERYHVVNAQQFYNDGQRWKVPSDPNKKSTLQPPYYLSMSRPGQDKSEFSLTTVFQPNNRNNLASFVSVNSEATSKDFGTMQILELPSSNVIDGPNLVANSILTDKGVSSALLPFEQSKQATIQRGNLLTLPVGGGLLYVQPVYIQRNSTDAGSYPVLQFVAASFGDKVGFGQTLEDALRVALGLEQGDAGTDGSDSSGDSGSSGDTGGDSGSGGSKTTAQYLEDAAKAYDEAQTALKDGDLAGYQSKIRAMNAAVENAQKALKK